MSAGRAVALPVHAADAAAIPVGGPLVAAALVTAAFGIETRENDRAGCFLCGGPFRSSYAEPVDAGGGIELCVDCGVLYGLPACC